MDGKGSGTGRELYRTGTDPLDSGTFSYSVGSDGSLEVSDEAGVDHGVLGSEGNVFTIAVTSGEEPGITVGIRRTPAAMPAVPLLLLEGP